MIMKRRLNAFAAAPGLMQQWLDFGNAIHKSGLDDSLMEVVKIRAARSMAAPCACTCTQPTPGNKARRKSASIYSTPGANRRCTPRASGPHWPGPKLSRWSPRRARPTRSTKNSERALHGAGTGESHALIVAINGWNRLNVGFRTVHPVAESQAA